MFTIRVFCQVRRGSNGGENNFPIIFNNLRKNCKLSSMPVLEVKDASYSYPQSKKNALNDVSFKIEKGDYTVILGANGSGKSTLGRLLAGFISPDKGKCIVEENVFPGIVFQQPKEQIVAGVVERDTSFGPENLGLSKDETELRTIECLSVIGMADRALSRTYELSLGQTQRIAFSGILALFPEVLILDEVTAMLDPLAREDLIEFVGQWNKKGHTIIHITHDEDEARKARRIIVLEKGSILFDGSGTDFFNDKSLYEKVFGNNSYLTEWKKNPPEKNKETALKVENLSFEYPERKIFSNMSFSLKKGTLTSLSGPSGCGKSTLFECLCGLAEPKSGTVKASSRPVLCLQESEASLFCPFAADDVAFGAKNSGFEGKNLVLNVKSAMETAGLSYREFADRGTFTLSGGEKRKLSIAGIIALNKDILIFDEPTSALDPYARKEVLLGLRKLADEGKTILFSTHRMEETSIADVNLKWEELVLNSKNQSESKAEEPAENESLELMEKIPNAAIISSLRKISASVMAPPEIPPSVISRCNGLVKFIIFALLFTLTLLARPLWLCGIFIFINAVYSLLAKHSLKKPLHAFKNLLPVILIFAILQFMFYPVLEGDVIYTQWKIFIISRSKIFYAVRMLMRACSSIICAGTFLSSTSEREIIDSLAILLRPLGKFKRYIVLVAEIILRFVPILMDELSGIIKTQIVRGVFAEAKGLKKLKILIPLFVPLMIQTFRKAQYLSDALTARRFK